MLFFFFLKAPSVCWRWTTFLTFFGFLFRDFLSLYFWLIELEFRELEDFEEFKDEVLKDYSSDFNAAALPAAVVLIIIAFSWLFPC